MHTAACCTTSKINTSLLLPLISYMSGCTIVLVVCECEPEHYDDRKLAVLHALSSARISHLVQSWVANPKVAG